jgi:hypothetical protein
MPKMPDGKSSRGQILRKMRHKARVVRFGKCSRLYVLSKPKQQHQKENKMKLTQFVLITLGIVSLLFTNADAGENLVQSVTEGCKVELEKYCGNVTLGEGRVLACLYAYGDKLSPKCEYALYDAAVQLERAVAALSYVANECDEDLEQYCSAVAPGGGRLLDCLKKKDKQLTKRCKEALKDVGLK